MDIRRRLSLLCTLVGILVLLVAHLPPTAPSASALPLTSSSGSTLYLPMVVKQFPPHLYGLDFSSYLDGQNPNGGSTVDEAQLRSRMDLVAPHTDWIRTFGMQNGLEKAGAVAHEQGLKAALGAWLSSETASNAQQISNLIHEAQAGHVDLAIVGSEVLLRGDLSSAALGNYISQVRASVPPGVLVTTADVFDEWLSHPEVLAAVDVVLANYYPYWRGIPVDQSIAALHDWHQLLTAAAAGKPVMVSETGWPSCGNLVYGAVPSTENASLYLLNFVSWARANHVSYFYFEAFDESWKATIEGPQGACWGIWDKNGALKPGMSRALSGETMADNWSGSPAIRFIDVPAYGSLNDLKGQVWHVNPANYKVAVYINAGGLWWTKPTAASPPTSIQFDGRWSCDITTGGNDQNATQISAYLVPIGYAPPLVLGSSTLPAELSAYPKAEINRSP